MTQKQVYNIYTQKRKIKAANCTKSNEKEKGEKEKGREEMS